VLLSCQRKDRKILPLLFGAKRTFAVIAAVVVQAARSKAVALPAGVVALAAAVAAQP
jgi:hypothetical protein